MNMPKMNMACLCSMNRCADMAKHGICLTLKMFLFVLFCFCLFCSRASQKTMMIAQTNLFHIHNIGVRLCLTKVDVGVIQRYLPPL